MTEEEKKLLKDLYSDIERYEMIEAGELFETWVNFFDETEEEILSEGREKKKICGFWVWQE